jgi:glycosyltransferase involved in cell wall biosynthesis
MPQPLVSIILPTYNRRAFLPQAFESIRGQGVADWELIVVDDGSTDGTGDLVATLAAGQFQPVRYVYQQNQGFSGARATGLGLATGKYVAFFDSDDYWLPHHLADCVGALEAHPEVDWVYGACRMVDFRTGRVLQPNTFYHDGRPWEFLRLRAHRVGGLCIIEDPEAARCMIRGEFHCGFQNSVVRRDVFAGGHLCPRDRNVVIDQLIIARALKAGVRFAYFDNVHVVYHVHDQNCSAVGRQDFDKLMRIMREEVWCYEVLGREPDLTRAERRAISQRLGGVYFWNIGYALLWQHGRRADALRMFAKGLRLWPWSLPCWKTYLLAKLRTAITRL